MRISYSILILCAFFVHLQAHAQHRVVEEWFPAKEGEQSRLYKKYHVKANDLEVKDSSFVEYYANGQVNYQGQFENNRAVGRWTYFYQTGNPKRQVDLRTENDGDWIYFFENGEPRMRGRVLDNKKEGGWVNFFETGAVKDSGSYVNGLKDGSWNYYYEDGHQKASALYDQGAGEYIEYYYSGTIKMRGTIRNNVSEGLWTYYYNDGAVKSQGYEYGGVKNGYWKYYHANGQVSSEGNYVGGKQDGDWKYFYPTGTLSQEGKHKNGYKDKHWKLYHEDGGLKAEGRFEGGTGEYVEFYPSGNKKVVGWYKKDKQDSLWTYYYEDGTVEGECSFEKGLGDYQGYYKSGNQKMIGKIKDGMKTGVWIFFNEQGDTAGYHQTIYDENQEPLFNIPDPQPDSITSKEPEEPAKKGDLPVFNNPNRKTLRTRVRKFPPFAKPNWEYHGNIISTNPLATIPGRLPVSFEFYWQERLGYEINYTLIRNPFWRTTKSVPELSNYDRGWSISFSQRFYKRKRDHGMLYFGQQFRYIDVDHLAKLDSVDAFIPNGIARMSSSTYEFVFLLGNRLIRDVHESGFTFDIFAGIGFGYQVISKNYSEANPKAEVYDSIFSELNQNTYLVPVRFGFSFGYIFGSNG